MSSRLDTTCRAELRGLVFQELESAERHELTEEEEATVAKRLSDLGYL